MLNRFILLIMLLPAFALAQNSIGGKVISMVNKKGVPAASVFLSNASVGNNTTDDGAFTLANVKNGQYDLVVSCVGYETYHQSIQINNADVNLPVIELMPKVTVLKEVTVKYNSERDRLIRMFTTEFLGRTDNAIACKLLNPEVVDLDYEPKSAILTASSADFLLVENTALGYRIKYLLKDFVYNPRAGFVFYSGSSTFEPMGGNASQLKRWEKKRIAAYRGSNMHFLRACIANNVSNEGFSVRRLVRKPNLDRPHDSLINAKIAFFKNTSGYTAGFSDSLQYWSAQSRLPKYEQTLFNEQLNSYDYIKLTQKKGIYAFGYSNCLQISYKGKEATTIITFKSPFAYFDTNGIIFNPDSNIMEGYWGLHRIGDLLPVDYELPATF